LALSDRIAVMSKGKTLQVDTAARLYEAPGCREVAGFIGSMNFFDGTVTNIDGDIATVDAGPVGTVRAPLNGHATGRGDQATVAVRPEKMQIAWQPPQGGMNAVAGLVAAEAYFGDRSHYHIEIAGLPHHIAVALQNSQRSLDTTEARGRQVWLTWPIESGVLLPRAGN
jgi:ABC-type Fe3+/spermidine/putrescine transport system ATPase subunit